jgi:nucleotide-binding universal stress UspA family protein
MTVRIIVPLDQSATAESALPLARTLASQLGGRITLISVLDVPSSLSHYTRGQERDFSREEIGRSSLDAVPDSPYGNWGGWSGSEPSAKQVEEIASETASAEQYLNAIAETFDGTQVEKVVKFGKPAERILEAAESRDNSIIVLASHGRTGIGRVVIGSVAARVVQSAHNPVFVVRARRGVSGAGMATPIRKVLAPVDGSTFAERTIPVLNKYFGKNESEISLLYVIETPRYANQAQAEEYVKWLARKVSEEGVSASHTVREGSPPDQILAASSDLGADLIAISTHGRSGLDRFVLGSVAERVLNEADVPVMLVPARMK